MHHEHNAQTNRQTAAAAERERQREREGDTAAERGQQDEVQAVSAGQAGNELDIRRAVMPVKMNAISSHRKWCQNVSRGPTAACSPLLSLSLSAAVSSVLLSW